MAFARLLFWTIVSLWKRWAATECELVLNAMPAGDKNVYNKLQPMIRFSSKMRQLEFLLLLAATSAQVPFSSTPLWNHSLLIFVKPHFAHAWNYILLIFVKPQFAHICETIICSHFVKLNFAHVCETKFCS